MATEGVFLPKIQPGTLFSLAELVRHVETAVAEFLNLADDVEVEKLRLDVGTAFEAFARDFLERLPLAVDFLLKLGGEFELLAGKALNLRDVLVDELEELP